MVLFSRSGTSLSIMQSLNLGPPKNSVCVCLSVYLPKERPTDTEKYEITGNCIILVRQNWLMCKSGAGSNNQSSDVFLCAATHLSHTTQHTLASILSMANRSLMGFCFHFSFSNKTYWHLVVRISMECNPSCLSAFCVASTSLHTFHFTPWQLWS